MPSQPVESELVFRNFNREKWLASSARMAERCLANWGRFIMPSGEKEELRRVLSEITGRL